MADKKNKTPRIWNEKGEVLCNVTTISAALGLTERRIGQLVKAGMPKVDRGNYVLAECIAWYYNEYKVQNDANSLLAVEESKARREEVKAQLAEIELAKQLGELLPKKVILNTILQELKEIKQHIYAIPKRNSIKLLQACTTTEIETILVNKFDDAFYKYGNNKKARNEKKKK